MELEKPLPLVVWVEGLNGRFFQKVEYEKISSLCFSCGKVGHSKEMCGKKCGREGGVMSGAADVDGPSKDDSLGNEDGMAYGPWILVNQKRRKYPAIRNLNAAPNAVKAINKVPLKPDSVRDSNPTGGTTDTVNSNVVLEGNVVGQTESCGIGTSVNPPNNQSSGIFLADRRDGNIFSLLDSISEEVSSRCLEASDIIEEGEFVDFDDASRPRFESPTGVLKEEEMKMVGSKVIGTNKPKLNKEHRSLGPLNSNLRSKKKGKLEVINKGSWMASTVYGSKDICTRRKLWEKLESHSTSNLPSIIGGDFNCILSQSDKKGGRKFSFSIGPQEMKSFMINNNFHEVNFLGPTFTWCNNKKGSARILESLDRCVLNSKALEVIHQASVRHLARVASDHCPIVLNLFPKNNIPTKLLRFEDVWLSYPMAQRVVAKSWSKMAFGNDMEVLNKKFYRALRALHFWSKGPRKKWMKEGDRDSSFFHSFASGRRNANLIYQLKDEGGRLVEDQSAIQGIFSKFFSHKWRYRSTNCNGWPKPLNCLSQSDCKFLNEDFSFEELELVVSKLGKNISPGLYAHSLIPLNVLKMIDRLCRDFLWNKKDGIRGLHFVSWQELCKSEEMGGHGIQSALSSIGPMRAKFAWNFHICPNLILQKSLYAYWNEEELMKFFGKLLVELIMQIEINRDFEEDKMELCNSFSGNKISKLLRHAEEANVEGMLDWKWIRKLDLSPRVACSWWRLLIEALPTIDFLMRRTLLTFNSYPRGCMAVKDRDHITTSCANLMQVITRLRRWGLIIPMYSSFVDCFHQLKNLSNVNPFIAKLYCSVVLYSWKSRNKGAFQHELSLSVWHPPPPEWVKVNVDATILRSNEAGVGGVFRDHKGKFLSAFGFKCLHWDNGFLELFAFRSLRRVIKEWMLEAKGLVIEDDNANVINYLQESFFKVVNLGDEDVLEDFSFLMGLIQLFLIM
ncbi:hypothetical protein M5K25_024657 [Dendrobium thyrsiflorum]|uniref:CCHC-type domain-containing protein n=1 Tax=Dendrobium thyrsiflorum TaxID=117978 RepID=A0ABD0U2U9_DENTH